MTLEHNRDIKLIIVIYITKVLKLKALIKFKNNTVAKTNKQKKKYFETVYI